ncbi:MAG: hypothetical protein LUG16_05080 [Candidatus Gastranaerophilales bacterium]|nr:hypothetical protein [Candidatus Gastranaerophilales bacterium]
MKKLFYILCILVLLGSVVPVSLAANKKNLPPKWVQLSDDIYIDINSVTKNKYNIVSAWFSEFASENNDLYYVNSIPVYYNIIKYEADCKSNGLALMHIKSFDENGRMLQDEPNNYDVCSGPGGVINGEIYFNALCSK